MSITYTLELETGLPRNQWENLALGLATTYLVAQGERLDQGIGVNGQQMPTYSEGYKRTRKKKGRQTRVRDLRLSNRMRRAYQLIEQTITDTGFSLRFGFVLAEAREIARYNHQLSPFVGFSESDIQAIQRALDDYIERANSQT